MKSVYLIGIGGIGVSALAQYLHTQGYEVYGADGSENAEVLMLREKIAATIYIGHDVAQLPVDCEFVVYSPAVPSDNPERLEAKNRRIKEYSYPEYLGLISEEKQTVAVAGTNGKTTTTAMVATLLDELGYDPTVIVGGIMPRFGSNFKAGQSDWLVVEACEYKESFLHIKPDILVLTNVTPDHLDHFGTVENYETAFVNFIGNIKTKGTLVCDVSDPTVSRIIARAERADVTTVDFEQYTHHTWNLPVPGEHNVCNAAASGCAATVVGAQFSETQKILETQFETADRRFQLLGTTQQGAEVYDDYGHNPEALALLFDGVRARFGDKKLVVVFQPHLFSRTADFFDSFVTQFLKVDDLFLLPIYPARERAEDFDVSSESLAQAVDVHYLGGKETQVCSGVDDCIAQVVSKKYDNNTIIITLGAGVSNQVGIGLVYNA